MTVVASNQAFIIAAYAVTWVVILGYLLRLVRTGARVRAEYERMVHAHNGETPQ